VHLLKFLDLALWCHVFSLLDCIAHLAAELEVESSLGPFLDADQGVGVARNIRNLSEAQGRLQEVSARVFKGALDGDNSGTSSCGEIRLALVDVLGSDLCLDHASLLHEEWVVSKTGPVNCASSIEDLDFKMFLAFSNIVAINQNIVA